jgi:two-component system OmpR family response regulator
MVNFMRILLVEDDLKIATFIKKGLEQSGHTVLHVTDGEAGCQQAMKAPFDVAVFDIMLPKQDGLSAIKTLRTNEITLPILVLSAKNLVSDKVKGLTLGADDYLTKPFSFSELLARLETLTRRVNKASLSMERRADDLVINLESRRVFRSGQEIFLQPKEFDLLRYLIDNQGRVVTKAMIIKNVWNYNFDPNTNIVETRMGKLREQIDREFPLKLIHTIRGVGYVLKTAT